MKVRMERFPRTLLCGSLAVLVSCSGDDTNLDASDVNASDVNASDLETSDLETFDLETFDPDTFEDDQTSVRTWEWSVPQMLSSEENVGRTSLAGTSIASVSTESGTDVYAIWSENVGRDENALYFRRSDNGGETWEPPVEVVAAGGVAVEPMLVAEPNGNLFVVWRDERNDNPDGYCQAYFIKSTNNGADWQGEIELTPGIDIAMPNMDVVENTDGGYDVHVVYEDYNSSHDTPARFSRRASRTH